MFILWWESNVCIRESAKTILAAFRMMAGDDSKR